MQQTYFVSTRQLSMELIARQYTSLVVADIRRRADISVDTVDVTKLSAILETQLLCLMGLAGVNIQIGYCV